MMHDACMIHVYLIICLIFAHQIVNIYFYQRYGRSRRVSVSDLSVSWIRGEYLSVVCVSVEGGGYLSVVWMSVEGESICQ